MTGRGRQDSLSSSTSSGCFVLADRLQGGRLREKQKKKNNKKNHFNFLILTRSVFKKNALLLFHHVFWRIIR